MTITLNVQNEQLFHKILQILNSFKNDGLEIITSRKKELKVDNLRLKHFEQIINTKSKNSIKIDEHIILNPHNELSHDISR